MTIKKIAHSAQQHLHARTGITFKRAHIYELLAASFGFQSYAALISETVIAPRPYYAQDFSPQTTSIRGRCIELGYAAATADVTASELTALLSKHALEAIKLPDLVAGLLENSYDDEDISPFLKDGLETAASKDNALAHYALALIYKNEEETEDDEHSGGDGSYWYFQMQQGRELVGVQREWADDYARRLVISESYLRHLRAAADFGSWRALVDLAERFNDPLFFERVDKSAVDDPARIAEVADRLGRTEDTRHWLTVAAEAGNTSTMRHLIETYDKNDLPRCWMWIYLAELVGTDLTKDKHYAINEDGSAYDDDDGGPAFVDGEDGVHLVPLEPGQDIAARSAAQGLFSRLKPAFR